MKKKNYGEILQRARTLSAAVERNMDQFEAIGVMPQKLEAMKNNIEAATSDFDQIHLIKQVAVSNQKAAIDAELRQKLRMLHAIKWFAVNNGNSRKGITDQPISHYTTSGLIIAAEASVKIFREAQSEYPEIVWNDTLISQVETLANQLHELETEHEVNIFKRKKATQKRHENFNLLYDDMTFFAELGKSIFLGVDPVSYEQYVLGFGTDSKTQDETNEAFTEPDVPDIDNSVDDPPTNSLSEPNEMGF